MRRIGLLLYYCFIIHLPHSRFLRASNGLRVWFIARVLGIMPNDRNSKVENNVFLSDGKDVRIGKHCRINENVFIQGAVIGDYVLIAPQVAILSKTHVHADVTRPMVMQGETEARPPIIENDVWIGRGAVIMPGVRIGRGSIVGACAVVTRDVAPFSINGGVPCRLIRYRDGAPPRRGET